MGISKISSKKSLQGIKGKNTMPLTLSSHPLKLGLALSLIISLAGCNSTPSKDNSYTQLKPQQETPLSPQQLLEKAEQAYGADKNRYWLLAATGLLQQGQTEWAQSTLDNVHSEQLDNLQFIRYSLLAAQVAMEDGSYFRVQELLSHDRLEQLKLQASLEQKQQLGELKASVFTLLGNTEASSNERMALSHWLNPTQQQQNHHALWQGLMMENSAVLTQLAERAPLPQLQAWYQLASIAKSEQDSIEQQQAMVEQWRQQWPAHPASINLPQDLQLLKQIIAEQPRRVALILPTTGRLGKAGQAIRDGFMVSLFNAEKQGARVPQVDFFDANKGDINSLYDQAVSAEAEFIIGPLDKNQVKQLNQRLAIPVPVLAMNYIAAPSESQQQEYQHGLFQFGLAAEDEARQCAQRAWLAGHKRAMILAPQTAWGNRGAKAFRDEWQQLGGVVVEEQHFTGKNDYSKVIENSLQLNQSKYRHRKLQQIINTNLEFEPRRRQDVDAVFLLANSGQARQVKPTLAFHYAGGLPVYATSHVYNGKADKKNNRDLDNIRFSALPWLLEHDSILQQQVSQHAQPAPAYQRLYALGADSFKVYPRIRQLSQVNSVRIQGGTGSLNMLQNGQIVRQQQWAIIKYGVAQALPSIAQLQAEQQQAQVDEQQ